MFGEDCRFPVQLKVDETLQDTTPQSKAKDVLDSVAQACASVRQNMATKQKASKAYYDLGATARHFKVGDKVRMHLKSWVDAKANWMPHGQYPWIFSQ